MQETAPPPRKLPQADSQFIKAFIAGGGAGMLAALITCPVEVVKTKLQATPLLPMFKRVRRLILSQSRIVAQQASSNLISVTRRVYATEGFRGFFRGVGEHLFPLVI